MRGACFGVIVAANAATTTTEVVMISMTEVTMGSPPGFTPRPYLTYGEFVRGVDRILIGEWAQLVAAGYLSEQGMLAVRARLIHGGEFQPSAGRDQLVLQIRERYAASRGIDVDAVPLEDRLAAPDDASQLDGPPEPA
jgi:hypothetical protein